MGPNHWFGGCATVGQRLACGSNEPVLSPQLSMLAAEAEAAECPFAPMSGKRKTPLAFHRGGLELGGLAAFVTRPQSPQIGALPIYKEGHHGSTLAQQGGAVVCILWTLAAIWK